MGTGNIDKDDDVQFLYKTNSTNFVIKCPSCLKDLGNLTLEQRTAHCNDHFTENPQVGMSSVASPIKQVSGERKQLRKPKSFSRLVNTPKADQDVFWRPSNDSAPPPNYTPELIPLLKQSLMKSHTRGATQKAYLCSPVAVHIGSESWDRGWGCGYRNYLMACAALMEQEQQPGYAALLEQPSPPGVRSLQKLVEEAWKEGYDEEGARQLKNRLVDTRKWIGTAELYVALTYRGVPACLVDFDLHKRGSQILLDWIIDYFSQDPHRHANINEALLGASPVTITNKPPIVLQHSGHSRTVVGFERKRDGSINLLMFDPSRRIPAWLRDHALSDKHNILSRANQSSRIPGKHKLSPSKLVKKVLHPQQSRRKRRASDVSIENTAAKRVRAGNEVIVIDSDGDENDGDLRANGPTDGPANEINWHKVAELFRVKDSSIAKKDKYQVLYFPLVEPLSDAQRRDRRVVTSNRIA